MTIAPLGAPSVAEQATRAWEGVSAPLRLEPVERVPMQVSGLESYFGTIELEAASDGIAVIDLLPLERYLMGLNEVPTDWPTAALRAQAVAARTYSLWTLAQPAAGAAAIYGFDICASEQCQVFSGAEVVEAPGGARWAKAVHSTAGQAVLYDGQPILARYHSTSGGRTLRNSEVFEGSPDLPYLQSVESPTEQASPFYRWTVRFRMRELQRVLVTTGLYEPSWGRLRDIRTAASRAGHHYPDVVLTAPRGTARVTAEELRAALRVQAPRLWPARYPSHTRRGLRLPETMPSNRVAIDAARHVVTIRGRGWGHGVGMSQWGALGMARQGAGYRDILRHYYRGTTIGEVSSPGPLEVGIAWARPSVAVLGAYRIVDGSGRVVVPRAFGTWSFDWSASGSVDVRSPEGYGTTPQVKLRAAPRRIPAGRVARLTIQLAAPARVAALASGPGAAAPIIAIKDAGVRSLRWKAPARPGRYRLRVRASNEMGRTSSGVRRVAVIADPRGPEGSGASPNGPWDTIALGLAAAVLLALVAVGSASFAATIRK